jgi:hypothetical protein
MAENRHIVYTLIMTTQRILLKLAMAPFLGLALVLFMPIVGFVLTSVTLAHWAVKKKSRS